MAQMDTGSVDLVFADPPFNLGKLYGPHFSDAMAEEEYVRWSREWIRRGARLLSPGGAFFLYNIPRWNTLNGAYMTELGLSFRHWIAIDIKFGLPIQGRPQVARAWGPSLVGGHQHQQGCSTARAGPGRVLAASRSAAC
ncbi:MAG: hypothetical protein LBG60_07955 [Bifidobacteriaceae bacterium]|jgi:site-specific DNA-methyltransferase (adenine-specific)|nr:hypothetical protein [Bifidobacteriaceae bacterium]